MMVQPMHVPMQLPAPSGFPAGPNSVQSRNFLDEMAEGAGYDAYPNAFAMAGTEDCVTCR